MKSLYFLSRIIIDSNKFTDEQKQEILQELRYEYIKGRMYEMVASFNAAFDWGSTRKGIFFWSNISTIMDHKATSEFSKTDIGWWE